MDTSGQKVVDDRDAGPRQYSAGWHWAESEQIWGRAERVAAAEAEAEAEAAALALVPTVSSESELQLTDVGSPSDYGSPQSLADGMSPKPKRARMIRDPEFGAHRHAHNHHRPRRVPTLSARRPAAALRA